MDVKKLVMGMVGIMICAVMVGGTLLPIVSSVTATSDTYVNEGYYTMDYVGENETVTVSWLASDPYTLMIDDVAFDLHPLINANHGASMSVDSLGIIRLVVSESAVAIRSYHTTGYYAVDTNNISNTAEFTITSNSIIANLTINGETTNRSITSISNVMVLNPSGDGAYTMKTGKAYVKGDSDIIFAGTTYIAGSDLGSYGVGSIADGITISRFYGPADTVYSNIVINSTAVDSHEDLYLIDSVTFDVELTPSGSETTTTGEITYSYFLVPTEVEADRAEPIDNTSGTLFNVLPIVAVAGLVMAGIYVFISRK